MEPVGAHRVDCTAGDAHERVRRGLLLLTAVVASSWLLRTAIVWGRGAPVGGEALDRFVDAIVVGNLLICGLFGLAWTWIAARPDGREDKGGQAVRGLLLGAGWTWAGLFALHTIALYWLDIPVDHTIRVLDVAGGLFLQGLTLVFCARVLAARELPLWVHALPRAAFLLLTLAAYATVKPSLLESDLHTLLYAAGSGALMLTLLATRRVLLPGEASFDLSFRVESVTALVLVTALFAGAAPLVRATAEAKLPWARLKVADGSVVSRIPKPIEGVRVNLNLQPQLPFDPLIIDAADQFSVQDGVRYGVLSADLPPTAPLSIPSMTATAIAAHLGIHAESRAVRFDNGRTQVVVTGPQPGILVSRLLGDRLVVAYVVRPQGEAGLDIWTAPETAAFLRSVEVVPFRLSKRVPLLTRGQWEAIARP